MTEKEEKLRGLLETIVLAIAKHTPDPDISVLDDRSGLSFRVNGKDQGRLVGKKGSVIWSIQTIFWFAGLAQLGWSYTIKLLEPETPKPNQPSPPFKFNPKWDRKKINNLFNNILEICLPGHYTFSFTEPDETSATFNINLPEYLKMQLEEPSFKEAIENVVRAAGMSNGVAVKTQFV